MISSNAFSYINVLDRTADASWLRQTMIANNLANVDTPTYKRQDIEFKSVLDHQLRRTAMEIQDNSVDRVVKNMDLAKLNGRQYTDYKNFSYRIDKNNVDVDTENVELASEQLNYQTLTTAISSEFGRFDIVTKS
ncbi:MAG: flagellar basal body rod protein FlgB [Lachnospiraceae bacterium]|nr:flagellar basal body rod protein FlgB [Lachnospiraceae bacterium]